MESSEIWGIKNLASGRITIKCAKARVACELAGDELRISGQGGDEEPLWHRWTLPKRTEEIECLPQLPDRPVLIKPSSPFHLAPAAKARLFVELPLSLAIRAGGDGNPVLDSFPTATLKQTWFGDPTDGELCYILVSNPRRSSDSMGAKPGLACSPFSIENASKKSLAVEQVCIRTDELALYESDGQFWTNETSIRHEGGAGSSEILVDSNPPSEAGKAALIAAARHPRRSSLRQRTFRSLRQFASKFDD